MQETVTLTKEDFELLKSQLKAELVKEVTGRGYTPNTIHDPLGEVRKKYINSPDGLLFEVVGPYKTWKAWEHIRRLSLEAVGATYVRDLDAVKAQYAASVAEELCTLLIDRRKQYHDE